MCLAVVMIWLYAVLDAAVFHVYLVQMHKELMVKIVLLCV